MDIIKAIATSNPNQVAILRPDASNQRDVTEVASFVAGAPTEVVVNRRFPGYRVMPLQGGAADEAIGELLATELRKPAELGSLRSLFAEPGIAPAIIDKLFPRRDTQIKLRKHHVSNVQVARAVRDVVSPLSPGESVTRAYTHVVTRVLDKLGVVRYVGDVKVVTVAESLVTTVNDMVRFVAADGLRELFSEARITGGLSGNDGPLADPTPAVLGDAIERLMRSTSMLVPSVQLRMMNLAIAIRAVHLYNVDSDALSIPLRAHPSLAALGTIANFLVYSTTDDALGLIGLEMNDEDVRRACDSVLTMLRGVPSIEVMPLKTYADFFSVVPASAGDGFRRGAVLYKHFGQVSAMNIVDTVVADDGREVTLVPAEYARLTSIAGAFNKSLTSVDAKASLAHLIADELALTLTGELDDLEAVDGRGMPKPVLVTMQIEPLDLTLLALARAQTVGLAAVRFADGTAAIDAASVVQPTWRLIYGCQVDPSWRAVVFAATPGMVYFTDPAAVLLYTSASDVIVGKSLPSRDQTLKLSYQPDSWYYNAEEFISSTVGQPYRLKLMIERFGQSEPIVLELELNVLGSLLSASSPDRSAQYGTVTEPGVDPESNLMLQIASTYMANGQAVVRDKAASWVVEALLPLAGHPTVQAMAQQALAKAIIIARLDLRAHAAVLRETLIRAYFGVALVALTRFNKVSGESIARIMGSLPRQQLSVQASLGMAALPSMMNGQIQPRDVAV